MRAAIDVSGLYTTQAGGARYIRGLLGGLRNLAEPLDFFEFAWPVENFGYRQPQRALKTVYREFIWGPVLANGRLRRAGADLVHTTGNVFYRPRVRHVATLHDLALYRHPERFRRWQMTAARRAISLMAGAGKIICISQFTADEAMMLVGIPAAKISVIYNGTDFQPGQSHPESPPDQPIPEEFYLFVGSLEPGKNLALLKEAWLRASAGGRTLPPLVIVGARWAGVPGEGAPPSGWIYLGRQPDAALVYLYRRARALLFPSKYEGFGLPVAEAQALGCPVICSRLASIPEVAGEAALYAEQTPESYLEAMETLRREPGQREGLIKLGLSQASRFHWDRCARETAAVYRETVG